MNAWTDGWKHGGSEWLLFAAPLRGIGSSPSSDKPRRIQRKRTKGWKMPPNTVYVGRPSKWGNPYQVEYDFTTSNTANWRVSDKDGTTIGEYKWTEFDAIKAAVEAYRAYADRNCSVAHTLIFGELRGKNLACWCPLDQPCHADILLELANAESSP